MNHAAIRETLLKSDDEYRRWAAKHEELEARLALLRSKRHLSNEEQLEEVDVKKKKLHLKDQMEARVRQHAEASFHFKP